MRYCVVKDCWSWKEAKEKKLKFFLFPKNPIIKKKWILACGKENVNTASGTICSMHFTDNDWRLRDRLLNLPVEKRLLDANAVPTQAVHGNTDISVNKRTERCEARTSKKLVNEAIEEYDLR